MCAGIGEVAEDAKSLLDDEEELEGGSCGGMRPLVGRV
jgi:hypothetical protein